MDAPSNGAAVSAAASLGDGQTIALADLIAYPLPAVEVAEPAAVSIFPEPLHPWQRAAKRALDIVAATVGLVVFAPVWLLTAVAIRLDSPGPAIYRQRRVGRRGLEFVLYKFRSMVVDAERETGPVWAVPGDPRVTRVGRLIRKLGIDEIPQLYNVLRGEMSLVGPRPERAHFVHQFRRLIPFYSSRLSVRPGITGLAQVRHKYDETLEDVKQKLKHDLQYVVNASLRMDGLIIVQTLYLILSRKGKF